MKKVTNVRNENEKVLASPKGEVGEIDTRAPFQSVKAAVSLFGEVAVSKVDKSGASVKKSTLSSENVLDKETQLMLAQREVEKYKHQLENAETTKARVQSELEKAKEMLEELTAKFNSVSESKRSAVEAAEAVKIRAKQLKLEKSQQSLGNAARKEEVDQARRQYMIVANELDTAKQLLNKVRQDFDAALEGKSASFQQAAEAQRLANINTQRIYEFSKEIKAMRVSEQQIKLASARAHEQQAMLIAERNARIEACKIAKAGIAANLETLRSEYDPDLTRDLEEKLAESTQEIEILQEEMTRVHASEMDAVKVVTGELKEATKTLQQVAEEESSLRNIVTSLRLELANVKRDQAEMQEQKAVKELVLVVGDREKYASVQRSSTLEQLSLKSTSRRWEAEEMKKNAEQLMQEAEKIRSISKETAKKLQAALREAEEAKAAEKKAHHMMKMISERHSNKNEERGKNIKISLEEFDGLKKKVRDCEDMAETKVAEAMMQVEAIKARRNEAEKKVEANRKAIKEIKEATEIALKSAEMAEAAQNVVEMELLRRRQKEQVVSCSPSFGLK